MEVLKTLLIVRQDPHLDLLILFPGKIEFIPKLETDLEFIYTTKDGTPYTVWIGSDTTTSTNPNQKIYEIKLNIFIITFIYRSC